MKLSNHLDFGGNEARSMVIRQLTSDPVGSPVGSWYFNTSTGLLCCQVSSGVWRRWPYIGHPSFDISRTISCGSFDAVLVEGVNYRVTCTYTSAGNIFADRLYNSHLYCSDSNVTISEEMNYKTEGKGSWLVYYPNGPYNYGSSHNVTLIGSAKGKAASGTVHEPDPSWTIAPIL